MELPRNITQIGETDRNCKIYVEDYVVSYMKQMNKFAQEKEIAVALFGKMSVEQQITYCFVYGAGIVQSISKEVRHLSQAQNQEVERLRKKYFPEQIFLGYQILNGEMIEGFRIYDQNSCRYVKGYACFFEKNDAMLAYMLETRSEEIKPETIEQDKYEIVKRRQEDRRVQFAEQNQAKKRSGFESEKKERRKLATLRESTDEKDTVSAESGERHFKVMPLLVTAGCCLLALTFWGRNDLLEAAKGQLSVWVDNISKQSFEENGEDIEDQYVEEFSGVQAVMSTLVTEDKLVNAILEENEKITEETSELTEDDNSTEAQEVMTGQEAEELPESIPLIPEVSQVPQEPQPQEQEPQPQVQQVQSYVIQQGDTLIAISRRLYGSEEGVKAICELNGILNPDNIQIGQKILLP